MTSTWDRLPPIARTLRSAMPLAVDHGETRASLSSHAQPATSVAPLTHTVSASAPAGIVWGLATLSGSRTGDGVVADGAPVGAEVAQLAGRTEPVGATFVEDAPADAAPAKEDAPRRFKGVLGPPVAEAVREVATSPVAAEPADEPEADRAALWARWVEVALASIDPADGQAAREASSADAPRDTEAAAGRPAAPAVAQDARLRGKAREPQTARAPQGAQSEETPRPTLGPAAPVVNTARPSPEPQVATAPRVDTTELLAAPRGEGRPRTARRPLSSGRPIGEVSPLPGPPRAAATPEPDGREHAARRTPEASAGPDVGPVVGMSAAETFESAADGRDVAGPLLPGRWVDTALPIGMDTPPPGPRAVLGQPVEVALRVDVHEVLGPGRGDRLSSPAQTRPAPSVIPGEVSARTGSARPLPLDGPVTQSETPSSAAGRSVLARPSRAIGPVADTADTRRRGPAGEPDTNRTAVRVGGEVDGPRTFERRLPATSERPAPFGEAPPAPPRVHSARARDTLQARRETDSDRAAIDPRVRPTPAPLPDRGADATVRPLVGDAAPMTPRWVGSDTVETVPEASRRVAEAATGTDLRATPVVRDRATAREAAGLGARAFARQGVVHLPRGLGPTGIEPARSLLVHELVHVAQQRTHGSSLPPESSREGRSLERAAATVAVTAAPSAPPPAPPPPPRVESGGGLVFGPPPAAGPATPAPVQRAPVDEPAATNDEREPEHLDLEDLARRLYPRIRPYLRKELSLDRERAGMALGTRR